MFELISGGSRHPFHDRTTPRALVSVASHVLAITGLLVIPLLYATDRLPSVAATMAFVAPELVAAAPPPPPPPPASNIARSRVRGDSIEAAVQRCGGFCPISKLAIVSSARTMPE